MQAEMKPGDTMILDRANGAGMTVRYLLPRPSEVSLSERASVPSVPDFKNHDHQTVVKDRPF
jgi:hypothetical protein